MGWRETTRTALEALAGHRMRSLLTMLGILIGIAAVMLTVGLGEGARRQINSEIDKLGSNLLIVMPGATASMTGLRSAGTALTLTLDDAAVLQDPSVAPDVSGVAPIVTTRGALQAGTENWSTQVVGTSTQWAPVRSRTLADGRFFSDAEASAGASVAVLGPTTAAQLFNDRPAIGQRITVNSQTFTVVGVLASVGTSSMSNDDDTVLVPLSTYAARMATGNTRSINAIYVAARDKDSISSAYQEIERAIGANHGTTPGDADFSIMTFQALMAAADSMTSVLTTLLGGIAGISLLVGGIGVMNIMLVSVTERTREIGLRQALGARPRDVLLQFLIEAVTLSLVGGLAGVVLGVGGAELFGRLGEMRTQIVPASIPLAFGAAAAVGVFFGYYPAVKAAQLDPIVALRHE